MAIMRALISRTPTLVAESMKSSVGMKPAKFFEPDEMMVSARRAPFGCIKAMLNWGVDVLNESIMGRY
jgi:hypothetical protein